MNEPNPSLPLIDLQTLRELVRSGEKVIIIDVRAPNEFAAGHVDGAINIPSDQLETKTGELPVEANIVTVCNFGGERSCNAAEQLHKLGYEKVAALRGGTRGWVEDSVGSLGKGVGAGR